MTRFAKLFTLTFVLVLACGVFLRGSLPQVSTGSFQSGAEMSEARSGAAAVTLDDGRVLVFGGNTASGATNAVQVFDPAANSWSDLGAVMLDARSSSSATALADGRILLAGGENSSGPLSSLELYDPASNSFASAGTLSAARKSHGAARLPDGRVLIIGGSDGSNALASSEIYDPESGSVSAGPSMSAPRSGASVTALLDGKILIAGGNNGEADLASTEIYNPADGSFTAGANLSAPRSGHSAILLPNNNSVLIAGGSSAGSDLSSAELYVPWTSSVSSTGAMSAARSGAAGSGLKQDGIALVAGGSGSASSELYGFATVKTDANDYAPGTTVNISGSGWQPGETVTMVLHEAAEFHGDRTLTAVADASGNIANSDFAPEIHDIGVRFYLTATGSSSTAQTTFTDAELVTAEVGGTANDVTVTQGSSAAFTINLSATGALKCTATSGSPATATVRTVYSISAAGVLSSSTPSGSLSFFAGTPISGPNCNTTWTGAPTPYSVSATVSTAPTTPLGDYTITLSAAAGTTTVSTPAGAGGSLADADATIITIHVVAPACTAPSISVNPANATKTVGDSVTFSVTASGTAPLSYQWRKGGVDIPGATSSSYTIASVALTDAGSYDVVVTNSCGSATSSAATLTVNKKSQTITFDALADKTYGDADFNVSATASSGLAVDFTASGDCTVAGTLVHITGAGSCTITAHQPGDATEWAAAPDVSQAFDINKATLTVTAEDKNREYGDANPSFTVAYSGFVNGENLGTSGVTGEPSCSTTAIATSPVSPPTYPITCTIGTLAADNYSFSFVNGALTITKAHLTVTADNASREYGEPNPTFTATLGGFKNGETLATSGVTGSASCTSPATPTSPVSGSPYAINCTQGTLAADNYDFTNFVAGELTITKAHLTVTANNASREYGDPNPSFTATLSGFKNGETLATSGVTGSASCTSPATPTSPVSGSPYAINCTQGTLAADNYDFTNFVAGELTITVAHLTVTADNKSMILNGSLPAFTFQITGFKNDENSSVLSTQPTCTTAATGTVIGSFAITCSGGAAANYDFTYVNGTLTVTFAPAGMCLNGPGHQVLQPIELTGKSVFVRKGGSTIPVKFRVCDANGVSIGPTPVVDTFVLLGVWNGTTFDPVSEDIVSTTPDMAFRWDGEKWIFNLSTKNLMAGKTYGYRINLIDGTYIDFQFGLK